MTLSAAPLIYVFAARPYSVAEHKARNQLALELGKQSAQAKSLEDSLQRLRVALARNEELSQKLQEANLQSAQSNERSLQKIGADLHDGPAQLLSYALLRINKFTSTILSNVSDKDAAEVSRMRSAIADTLKEVRHISTGLSPPGLDSGTLYDAIRIAISLHEQHTGTAVRSKIALSARSVSDHHKVCAYRVVQEALNNAYRHGGGKEQTVCVDYTDHLTLEISDAGPGFVPEIAYRTGLGISGMRARVESLGGRFQIVSQPGSGTRVIAMFDFTSTPDGSYAHG